jgi:hypothetical protein
MPLPGHRRRDSASRRSAKPAQPDSLAAAPGLGAQPRNRVKAPASCKKTSRANPGFPRAALLIGNSARARFRSEFRRRVLRHRTHPSTPPRDPRTRDRHAAQARTAENAFSRRLQPNFSKTEPPNTAPCRESGLTPLHVSDALHGATPASDRPSLSGAVRGPLSCPMREHRAFGNSRRTVTSAKNACLDATTTISDTPVP